MFKGKGYFETGEFSQNALEAMARGERPVDSVRRALEVAGFEPSTIEAALDYARRGYHHVGGDFEVVDFADYDAALAYCKGGKEAAEAVEVEKKARLRAENKPLADALQRLVERHELDRRRRQMALRALRAAGFQVNELRPDKVVVVGHGLKRRGKPENLAKELVGLDVFKEVK